MDKETLSNYGWVVILVLILAVLLALATPFGTFVSDAVKTTTQGLFDVNQSALNSTGLVNVEGQSFAATNNSSTPVSETTYYTVEEIEADEHLYAIGKTKKEYVVAKFNADYSEVVITKNGDDSDGEMREFNSWTGGISPLSNYSSTLKHAIVKSGVNNIGGSLMGNGLFSCCTNLEQVELPNTIKTIGDNAFHKTGIRNIIVPDSVTFIGITVFSDCVNLSSIKLSNNIDVLKYGLFMNCINLKEITIPSSINKIDASVFSGSGLETIVLPDSITSVDYGIFGDCNNLKSVVLSKNLTIISQGMFHDCISLETIVIPSSVTTFDYYVFGNCINLKTIYLPKSITTLYSWGEDGIPQTFFDIGNNSIIYCETQEVANLLEKDVHYNGTTQVIIDPSKF